jgi:hypothetical protein
VDRDLFHLFQDGSGRSLHPQGSDDMNLLVILILILLLFGGGGSFYAGRSDLGINAIGLLVIVLLVLALTGRLR